MFGSSSSLRCFYSSCSSIITCSSCICQNFVATLKFSKAKREVLHLGWNNIKEHQGSWTEWKVTFLRRTWGGLWVARSTQVSSCLWQDHKACLSTKSYLSFIREDWNRYREVIILLLRTQVEYGAQVQGSVIQRD